MWQVKSIKLSDLNKRHMKREGPRDSIKICEKKIQISPMRPQKLSISTSPIINKNTIYVGSTVINMYAKYQLYPLYGI